MELSFPRMWALDRNDLRILRSDPAFVLIFTIMPLAFMAFTKGAFGASLAVQYPGRGLTGAEQVVPGAAVMFSGFMVGNLGFGIFREHSWATWDRLRASQLGTAEIMIAKGVTPMLVLILQMTVMLGAVGVRVIGVVPIRPANQRRYQRWGDGAGRGWRGDYSGRAIARLGPGDGAVHPGLLGDAGVHRRHDRQRRHRRCGQASFGSRGGCCRIRRDLGAQVPD